MLYFLAAQAFALTAVEKINYQGRLIEGTNLVSGSRRIVFRLFNDASAGIELYGETQTVNVVDSLYSATIGTSNTVPGSLVSALAENACFLEVEIGGTVLSPREEVAAVAHALSAVSKSGDTMTGPLVINAGAENDIQISSSGSSIAIGGQAGTASGTDRIALGRNITNAIDNTAALRGTLYLDGGTNIYFRSSAGEGPWQELFVETDPLWLAEKGAYATGSPVYVETDPVWVVERSNYATGAPLYEYSETDPLWVSERGDYATGTPLYVETDPVWTAEKAGYATGTPLYAYTETDPSWASSSNDVEIRILNIETARVSKVGDEMTGALAINVGVENAIIIDSAGTNVAIGYLANAAVDGVAVGWKANALTRGASLGYNAFSWSDGVALGYSSYGPFSGTAVGCEARADSSGVGVGRAANGSGNGAAIGYEAQGTQSGVALGRDTEANDRGVAAGRYANGLQAGISIGYNSRGISTNIAIGYGSRAYGGPQRIAIGNDVVNGFDNSISVRGTLYLDGGTGIMYRASFGDTNGWSVKAFAIDHPLDPENKILRHYSMEGPEVWNVYAGNAQVINGSAVVELPAYYSALNLSGSEIYSFTPVGVPAVCYVKQKVSASRFVIGADRDCEVSWTVKARRNDPAAREDLARRPVEQLKSEIPSGPEPSEIEQQNTSVISP